MPDKNLNSHLLLDKNAALKTLGLKWDPHHDKILYSVKSVRVTSKITKRSILSEIAKIYDPLGLLGPITLHAKLIV